MKPLAALPLIAAISVAAPVCAEVAITEFAAENDRGLRDEDQQFSDWIEIANTGATPVDLSGYHLTDDAALPEKWAFPTRTLAPGEFLVVFASGKDRAPAEGELHTNFELQNAGEYLALIAPGGEAATEFAPSFPTQYSGISYGPGVDPIELALVNPGAEAAILIPANAGDLPADWATAGFPATVSGPTGAGYQAAIESTLAIDLALHATMDNADVGGGSGADTTDAGAFDVRDPDALVLGQAIAENTGGNVTAGASGVIGEAIDFSDTTGGNRRVDLGPQLDPGTGSLTVSLWINARASSGSYRFIASKGNRGSADNGWAIWTEGERLYLRAEYTGSNNTTQNLTVNRAFGASELNAWHHIVMVLDNGNGILTGYYDGATSGASGTENGWSNTGGGGDTHTFAPGSDFSSASNFYLSVRDDLTGEWPGRIDDLAAWTRPLSPAEAAEIYNAGLAGNTLPRSGAGLSGLSPLTSKRR
ncbi:MAG: LamG-like jellyroll fold domain-containing protein [Verrucomicrobiales bacterium]